MNRCWALPVSLLLWIAVLPEILGAEAGNTVMDFPSATQVVKLEFGLNTAAPKYWSGEAEVSAGRILASWGWHFDGADRIEGVGAWDFHTRLYNPEGARYRLPGRLPGDSQVLPNGVYLAIDAPDTSTLTVRTNNGTFGFSIADLKDGGRIDFLAGEVQVFAAPAVRALTQGEASQHDFPAAAVIGNDLFVAWTTYHNEANAVYLARLSNGKWATYRATSSWGDYYGTAIAADGESNVHLIWSEYSGDRWRLVDRVFRPESDRWDRKRYVASEGSRQYFPKAVTASDGHPWVTWQEFRENNLDVMVARFDAGGWGEPIRVSHSDANDWAPAIAAAYDGSVWVAWDTYDAGNYDVFMRRIRSDRAEEPIAGANSPMREIEPSISVDSKGRVWLAWAESGPNWGKDWGVLGKTGTQLRQSSRVRLARYADGRWMEPRVPLEETVPEWMSEIHEYPKVVVGSRDVPYVFFRKSMLRHPAEDHELKLKFGGDERVLQPWYDTIRGMSNVQFTAFDGSRWLSVRDLPLSTGGAYSQLSKARLGDEVVAVWATDGRSYQDPHFRTSQIRYAELALDAVAGTEQGMRALRPPQLQYSDAAPTESVDLARVRQARWDDAEPLKLYRGDLHRHTDLSADSQSDGDILLNYRYALDAGALDFLAITDHSGAERMHFYNYQWWRTRQVASMFNQPGRFATFFGYERTITFPGGHRNVISTRRSLQPVPISDEEFYGVESWAERLYPSLIDNGDIAIAHTTAGGGGTDWRDNDSRAEPVVEVFQALRGSYEEANSPGKANTNQPQGFVWNAWKKGWKLGLIANSDHGSTHQSYACVWATQLSNDAILRAIKQRRTFAATDNIILQFEAVDSLGNRHKMGSELSTARPPELRLRVAGTGRIRSIEIIRNGNILHSVQPAVSTQDLSYRDNNPPGGTAYYHARIVQQDGQIAWSSPIWVHYGGFPDQP